MRRSSSDSVAFRRRGDMTNGQVVDDGWPSQAELKGLAGEQMGGAIGYRVAMEWRRQ